MATATNTPLTPTAVTRSILTILHNNLVFCRSVNRQYDGSNHANGQKDGGSVKIRLPNQYATATGAALSLNNTVESSVTLSQSTQRHVDTSFTTQELSQEIEDFSERISKPAASVLASVIDYDAMSMYQGVYNSVGTPGTTPATALTLLNSHKYMNYFATPQTPRFCNVNPDANAALVDGLKGLFQASGKISDQYKTGMMGMNTLGFQEFAMTQNVRTHTTGSFGGTTLIDGTLSVEGTTTIHVDGFTSASAVVNVGDVFTVADCYSVNPETKQSTGQLQQFVVTATATASSNEVDLSVLPAVYTSASGALQTVDSFPTDGKAVTFVGTASTAYPQNVAYHRDAFVFATTDLEMPQGVHWSARQVMDGISMRAVRQYRIDTDDIPTRFDVLYGYVNSRPSMSCRIWG